MRCTIISLCSVSLCLVQVFSADSDRPVVETPSGTYRGHVLSTRNGRDILAFQGIPYALPPTGQLRFKLQDPVKPPKLEGMFEANDQSRICFQPTMNLAQMWNISFYEGSEDCLYLNVYVPKIEEGVASLPVLAWIHGGGYFVGSGSTDWNGPTYLLDRDMILVTMNYRLQILGFLSRGDSVMPGNLGMKDQVMALEWIQQNIASFGGDPNSVTIGGVSAGGSSASLHMHSPLSKGLFDKAIAQSGNAHCPFGFTSKEKAREVAKKVANFLGCSFKSDKFLKCLRKMPLTELFEASKSIIKAENIMTLHFYPVIEEPTPGAFLTRESINEPSQLPLIAGVTSNEAMYMIREFAMASPKYEGDLSKLLNDMTDLMPIMGYYRGHPKEGSITRKLFDFYFNDGNVTELKATQYCSDVMMNHGLILTGRREKGPTYIYKFSYVGANKFRETPEELKGGVSHAEECMYLFDGIYFPRNDGWTDEDLKLSNELIDMWYNFMRTGDPSPDSKLWEESQGGVKYLDFTNQGLNMESNMFQSRMDFLDHLNIDMSNLIIHDEL